MAEKQYSKIGKTYKGIFNSLDVAPIKLASQDIESWKKAINAARDKYHPRRRLMYELFDNIGLDGKVVAVREKRIAAITNKDFVFCADGKEGKPVNTIMDEIINTEMFDDLLENLERWEAFYGHLVLELVPGSLLPIEKINALPMANVVPETGLILPNYMDTTNGIPFRGSNADPFCQKYILEFGRTHNYGLLSSISQYVIYKRGGFGDWAQFAELFGMPFRVGKYNPLDPNSRKLLNDALKLMGGAGFATIPEGTSLDFMQSNFGSGQSGIFKDLVNECDDQIAQIALGGTMTTKDGSSHAQGEIHQEGEYELSKSRMKKILKFLNGPFRERLAIFGYGEAKTGKFKVESEETIALTDRITIDMQVSQKVKIEPSYWYDTYGVLAPESGPEAIEEVPLQDPSNEDPAMGEPAKTKGEKKKAKLSVKLAAYYKQHSCIKCGGHKLSAGVIPGESQASIDDAELERLAKLLYNGKLKNGKLDKKLFQRTAAQLMQGITSGYLRTPGSDSFTAKDEEMVSMMRENVFVFSGFKNYQQLKEASALLLDADGKVKSFADFKKDLLQLDHTYNVAHAEPEYELAVASSQMASKWTSFKNLGPEFQNWKYSTAGDERVRLQHALLNGMIFRVGDPKTDNLFPPNGWRCRCDGDATDEATTGDNVNVQLTGMFDNNVGKTGVVFPKDHPYYEANEAAKKRINDFVKTQLG